MDDWKSSKEALIAALQKAESPDQLDDGSRAQLTGMLEAVNLKIQSPIAFLGDLAQSPIPLVAARIGIAMGIFDAFGTSNFEPMSTEEINAKTKGDEILLTRILRLLSSHNMVQQLPRTTWKATSNGAMLTTGSPGSMFVVHFHSLLKCHANILEYFERHAFGTEKGYFGWLEEADELLQTAFNTVMTMSKAFRGHDWFEHYPVEKLLSTTSDRTILVDIGGGLGQDVIAFKKRYPDLPGKIVLQDLPKVIQSINEPFPEGIEKQGYDAFTPQPVKGAKAYYMRNVLHDWPDMQALEMLENIRNAMAPDSVLLINENILAEEQVPRMVVGIDFILMGAFGAMERTESQWKQLLNSAGFGSVKVWYPTEHVGTPHALFEATVE